MSIDTGSGRVLGRGRACDPWNWSFGCEFLPGFISSGQNVDLYS